MLKFLRKKKNIKRIIWGLAIVIIPAFVLWGAGSAIRDKTRKYAGAIYGKKVSLEEYLKSWQAVKNQALMTYGEGFRKIAKYLPLEAEAWDRLILLEEAKTRRIPVDDKEVVAQIKTYPFFQRNGIFDQKIYTTLLTEVFRTTPRNFEQETRETLLISKLIQVISAHIMVSESEIKEAYKEENEEAKVSYILIEPKEFEAEVEVTEKELEEYYKQHAQEFKTPDKVNVEYVAAEYSDEETRQSAEEKIWGVWEESVEANNLNRAAQKHNLPLKETGYFAQEEQIPQIGWSYPLSKAAFELEATRISEVIETPKAYYILRLKGKKEPYIPSFEEVREKVEIRLRQNKAGESAREKAEEYYSKISESLNIPGVTFEDAANNLSLEIKTSEPFTRRGYIPEIGQAEVFSSVFNLEISQISNSIPTPKGYCILRLDALTPINEEKFAEEKEDFEKKVIIRKKTEYYRQWLNQLRTKANLKSNLKQPRNQ